MSQERAAKHSKKKGKPSHFMPQEPRKPELLAPAGDQEAFYAAMDSGADAVYVSPRILNARAYGKNFTLPEIGNLLETAHKKRRKLFVAINALMKEKEMAQAIRLMAALDEMGVDAVIIQDLGIWRIARRYFPGLRLHASTLMAIHNSLGVEMAKEMGFSRVVLARELTLKEISAISKTSRIQLEIFVHGAMCFTISGLCLFSSYFGGRSSTRGKCVQPCRRRYTWKGGPGTYFSMDDLCGLEMVPELYRLGISSLKIEGRLKPARYVASVTKAYRLVLDEGPRCSKEVLERARTILNGALGRPVSSGFFLSSNPKGAVSPTRTANTGLYLGKVKAIIDGWLHLSGPHAPKPGDRLRLVVPRNELQFSVRCVEAKKTSKTSIVKLDKLPQKLPENLSGTLLFKIDAGGKTQAEPAIKITGEKDPLHCKAMLDLAAKRAKDILKKIENSSKVSKIASKKKHGKASLYLKLARPSDIKIAGRLDIKGVLLEINSHNIQAITKGLPKGLSKDKIIWSLPPVIFQDKLATLKKQTELLARLGFKNFQVSNLSHLALLKGRKHIKRLNICSSYQLNILNSQAIKAASDLGIFCCHFSIETDLKNMTQALSKINEEVMFTVFCFVPLFTSRLRHRLYHTKKPVVSTRGEQYHWQRAGDVGRLFPKTPFSALDCQKLLLGAGIRNWIIDLEAIPRTWHLPRRLPQNVQALASKLRGRSFNLLKNLE